MCVSTLRHPLTSSETFPSFLLTASPSPPPLLLSLMFVPDNQERLLSAWLTAPGGSENSAEERKVSAASLAGHASFVCVWRVSGHDVLAQLLSFEMGTAIVFFNNM